MRRRTIFPPIRPRPMTPIFMCYFTPTISFSLTRQCQGHNEATAGNSHDARTAGRMVLDGQAARIATGRSFGRGREIRLRGAVVSRIAWLRIDVAGWLSPVEKPAADDRQLDRQHICPRFLYRTAGPGVAERSVRPAIHPRPGR